MESVKIILLCVFAAITYGIIHDQFTARICVEYFTVAHPPVFQTDDPTLLAIGWGILATWWVGLILGLVLIVAARAGHWPKRDAHSLLKPILWLLGVMALGAFLSGLIGWSLADSRALITRLPILEQIPESKVPAFQADLWAHNASYAIGFVGGLITCFRVWRSRVKSVSRR